MPLKEVHPAWQPVEDGVNETSVDEGSVDGGSVVGGFVVVGPSVAVVSVVVVSIDGVQQLFIPEIAPFHIPFWTLEYKRQLRQG